MTTNEKPVRSDRLALLCQGLFTVIVRIQSGKQVVADPDTLRRRTKAALGELEKEAEGVGYSSKEVRDAEFALVALLDEVILSSKDLGRAIWKQNPLNVEMFGQAIAGEAFFDRLSAIRARPSTEHQADLLEVYLMCLLLGFEGRYSGLLRGEAALIAERLRLHIDQIRGTDYRLSPAVQFAATEPPLQPVERGPRWWPQVVGPLAIAFLLFVFFKVHLYWRAGQLEAIK